MVAELALSRREQSEQLNQGFDRLTNAIVSSARRTEETIRIASERTNVAIQAAYNRSDAIHQASLQPIFDVLHGRTGIKSTSDPAHSMEIILYL
jgi:hypothetical protein